MSEPYYWMSETTGVLRRTIEAYVRGDDLTLDQIATMRAYLRQWIFASWWAGDDPRDLAELKDSVRRLDNQTTITAWLNRAARLGIDPL